MFNSLFQCYDKYSQQNLRKAAKLRGHSFWARGPDNAGQYNSRPHETGFFCERGDYDSYYGRFFLHWYGQSLIDHADNVLSLATLAFEETQLIVKVWWFYVLSFFFFFFCFYKYVKRFLVYSLWPSRVIILMQYGYCLHSILFQSVHGLLLV